MVTGKGEQIGIKLGIKMSVAKEKVKAVHELKCYKDMVAWPQTLTSDYILLVKWNGHQQQDSLLARNKTEGGEGVAFATMDRSEESTTLSNPE